MLVYTGRCPYEVIAWKFFTRLWPVRPRKHQTFVSCENIYSRAYADPNRFWEKFQVQRTEYFTGLPSVPWSQQVNRPRAAVMSFHQTSTGSSDRIFALSVDGLCFDPFENDRMKPVAVKQVLRVICVFFVYIWNG